MAFITLYTPLENTDTINEILIGSPQLLSIEKRDTYYSITQKKILKKKKIGRIRLKNKVEAESGNQFTNGFVGYLQAELKGSNDLKNKFVLQGNFTKTIISFDIKDEVIESVWGNLLAITSQFPGLLLLPSGIILSSNGDELVDENGVILVDQLDVKISSTDVITEFDATVENQGRRKASQNKLMVNDIPYTDTLALLPDSNMIQRRSTVEIAKRASVLIILIQFVRELLDDKENINIKTARRMSEVFLNRYGVKSNLTPDEEKFLAQDSFEDQELINRMWLYESAWVMLWSIGLIVELSEPTEICDVDALLALIADHINVGELISEAAPISTIELLDRMDENYLYLWACIEIRVNGLSTTVGLDEGVVMERQRAFNWLVSLHDESWDTITINA